MEQSYEKAIEYYQKAADLGSGAALFNLAVLYADGRGVEQSFEKAEEYYRKAADLGYEKAINVLDSWKKNGTPTPLPVAEPTAAQGS